MQLKCNVCKKSPTVDLPILPSKISDLICCPNCDKQLAYATEKIWSKQLIWTPLDTDFNIDFGGCPVTIIKN